MTPYGQFVRMRFSAVNEPLARGKIWCALMPVRSINGHFLIKELTSNAVRHYK